MFCYNCWLPSMTFKTLKPINNIYNYAVRCSTSGSRLPELMLFFSIHRMLSSDDWGHLAPSLLDLGLIYVHLFICYLLSSSATFWLKNSYISYLTSETHTKAQHFYIDSSAIEKGKTTDQYGLLSSESSCCHSGGRTRHGREGKKWTKSVSRCRACSSSWFWPWIPS